MSNTNNGGPAFPTATLAQKTEGGMTLRDYFAAKAMQALLSSPNCPRQVNDEELARQAYEVADAMLKARGA
jgi:hypothetical protein